MNINIDHLKISEAEAWATLQSRTPSDVYPAVVQELAKQFGNVSRMTSTVHEVAQRIMERKFPCIAK